jgi:hypothetical protein
MIECICLCSSSRFRRQQFCDARIMLCHGDSRRCDLKLVATEYGKHSKQVRLVYTMPVHKSLVAEAVPFIQLQYCS